MSTQSNGMDIQQIMDCLPHRYPFLLIDRVLDFTPGEELVALKNVTMNEPCFTGHFPDKPVFPGVLMLEALAQATGVLANKSYPPVDGDNALYYFAAVDNARFRHPVGPGDTLILKVKLNKFKRGIGKFYGEAFVGDTLVCSADLMCARRDI